MPNLDLPTVLSQSSLQDYLDCARRFELRYIDRLHYPAVESEPALENERHQQAGENFHRLVQQSLLGLPDEKLARQANTPDLARWWQNFKEHGPDLSGFTIFPELTLSAPLGGFRLIAKYDLVAIGDGRALIYDWKTYRKRPRPDWLAARLQTRVYRALLTWAGAHLNGGAPIAPESIEMLYWFAEFPAEPASFRYDAAQLKRDADTLNGFAREIAEATDFPLTDDRQKCVFCPYRSYCDRGVTAGEFEQAEAEMESESVFDVNFEQIGEIEF